jgi:hypothetical protein
MSIHPSDEELLDVVLSGDAEVAAHVAACAECAARHAAVVREQAMFREAFAEIDAPARLRDALRPRASRWPWAVAAAAALLLGTTTLLFALQARAWKAEASRAAADAAALRNSLRAAEDRRPDPEESRWKMKNVAHKVDQQRDAFFSGDPKAIESMTVELEGLGSAYADCLEWRLGELTPDQKRRINEAMDRFTGAVFTGGNAKSLSRELLDAMRDILPPAQFTAFTEGAREEAAWAREDAISMLIDELVASLDLRHSEGERLRELLEESYPQPDLFAPFLMASPSDPLLDDARLARSVRDALDASCRPAFDTLLKELARQRTEIEKALRPK